MELLGSSTVTHWPTPACGCGDSRGVWAPSPCTQWPTSWRGWKNNAESLRQQQNLNRSEVQELRLLKMELTCSRPHQASVP